MLDCDPQTQEKKTGGLSMPPSSQKQAMMVDGPAFHQPSFTTMTATQHLRNIHENSKNKFFETQQLSLLSWLAINNIFQLT